MKCLLAIFIALVSNTLLAQGYYPYNALNGMKEYSYEEALNAHHDSVYVIKFSEEDKIPKGISRFKHLMSIQIEACVDMNIDKELSNLKNSKELIHIAIGGYYGSEFPDAILKYTQLKALELKGMEFSTVPDEIENLRNLEYLSFGDPGFGGCQLF